MINNKIAFVASNSSDAQEALSDLSKRYPHVPPEDADIIVALGGDGFMLSILLSGLSRYYHYTKKEEVKKSRCKDKKCTGKDFCSITKMV